MSRVWQHVSGRALAVAVAVLLLAATFFVVRGDDEVRTVTAHFPRAVSVYEGSEVRILGVKVGRVTAVVPEGNSVRVEMEYDAEQKLPADAKAAVITPTLVADRFVQLTPAYTGGPVMEDDADIPLPDSGVPVELDRIYSSLRDLSEALGPNGVNRDGTLDNLLKAGSRNLEGEGRLGNQMLRDLSAASATFGRGSGDLFGTVTELAKFTQVLGNERPPGARVPPGPRRCLVGARRRTGRARAHAGRGGQLGRRRRGFRARQPHRAGHRPGEADPGHEDHQLRAGQPRHGSPGGPARAGQPGPRVQHPDRVDRLPDRPAGHLRQPGRPAVRDRDAVRHAAPEQERSPAGSSRSCWSRWSDRCRTAVRPAAHPTCRSGSPTSTPTPAPSRASTPATGPRRSTR